MKILIIGGSSFIGESICFKHIELGDDVYLITRNKNFFFNNSVKIINSDAVRSSEYENQ